MSNENILLEKEKPDSNELAIERTIMAAERTLMSWTRTSISLISFGFTIYKFLQYMQEQGKAVIVRDPAGPRNFGFALDFHRSSCINCREHTISAIAKETETGKETTTEFVCCCCLVRYLVGIVCVDEYFIPIGAVLRRRCSFILLSRECCKNPSGEIAVLLQRTQSI